MIDAKEQFFTDQKVGKTIKTPSIEVEQALIASAKAGDNEATKILMKQYEPALRGAVNRHSGQLDHDELLSAFNVAFVEALHSFNPAKHSRLAAVIKHRLKEELAYEKTTAETLHIPVRTVSLYSQILNKAGGDIFKALEALEDFQMSKTTFLHIHNILRNSAQLEDILQVEARMNPIRETTSEASESAKELIRSIIEVRNDEQDLTEEELQVVLNHYGFIGNANVKTFTETAFELNIPQKSVIKLHNLALAKARTRLSYNS